MNYEPIEVAVALSLYGFNVSPGERAEKLYKHFDGNCAELEDLLRIMDKKVGYAATELAPPTAEVYVIHALEKYGEEAREHVRINRLHIDEIDLSSLSMSLRLNRESWENLLGVIKMCVPVALEPKEQRNYFDSTGKEWTVGDFWSSVDELQTQLGQEG